jgi:hypothetical protein
MNRPYLEDSSLMLQNAAERIANHIEPHDSQIGLLCFAIGLEKAMKAILYAINPLFVLKSQDFDAAAVSEYRDRLSPQVAKELANKKLSSDVITMRMAVYRLRAFSEVVVRHTSLLHDIASVRDAIAHRVVGAALLDRCEEILQRHFFPLVCDFASELGVEAEDLAGPAIDQCAVIAAEHQESVEATAKVLLNAHQIRWQRRILTADERTAVDKRTQKLMGTQGYDAFNEPVECPACSNTAVLYLSVDFDVADGQAVPMGVYVSELRCEYCELSVEDPELFDELGVNEWFERDAADGW